MSASRKKIGKRVGRAGVCIQFSFGRFSNPVSVLASKPFSVYLRKDPLAAVAIGRLVALVHELGSRR
jgi:hypothetical protein